MTRGGWEGLPQSNNLFHRLFICRKYSVGFSFGPGGKNERRHSNLLKYYCLTVEALLRLITLTWPQSFSFILNLLFLKYYLAYSEQDILTSEWACHRELFRLLFFSLAAQIKVFSAQLAMSSLSCLYEKHGCCVYRITLWLSGFILTMIWKRGGSPHPLQ